LLREGFRPRTPKTETEPDVLRARLAEVRALGYAREDEQSELGMRSIAAPVRDSSGLVVGAVGMAGPLQRLSNETLARYAPLVVETANVISIRLGYKARAAY
jgi:DNA-binding IclR family transcriptional regulator